jgi:MFS family permease
VPVCLLCLAIAHTQSHTPLDFLTQAGFMLTVGQIITICNTKLVYLTAITIFEIGSLFCAVAPNIEFLIFGRAVAGVGASGYRSHLSI